MKTEHAEKRSKPGSCLRLLGRGLLGVLVFLVILAAVGFVYEHAAAAQDMKRYPPPGRLVEVNGHKLHINCTGAGATTVVLETQANSSSMDWGLIQPEIAHFARVCSYDRAGFGWSELDSQPRTAQHEADELYQLLNKAGEQGPYVLVGSSLGGHIVRIFAHDHPDAVRGVILADARPEKLGSLPVVQREIKSGMRLVPIIVFLGEVGLQRLMVATVPEKMIPASAVPFYNAPPGSYEIVFQSKLWHASYAEAKALDLSDAQVAAAAWLGDTPLIVIRHGKPTYANLPPQEAEEMERTWKTFQEEIAEQSSAGQLLVAENSAHNIQYEQPEIIIESVRQVLGNP